MFVSYWGQPHLLLNVPRHQRRANIFKLAHHLLTVAVYVRGGTFNYKTSLWIMGLYRTRLILKPSNGTQTSRPFPLVKNTAGNSEILDIQQVLVKIQFESFEKHICWASSWRRSILIFIKWFFHSKVRLLGRWKHWLGKWAIMWTLQSIVSMQWRRRYLNSCKFSINENFRNNQHMRAYR